MAGSDGALRDHGEGLADLGRVVAGGQDPAILEAHLSEDLAEARGAAVIDAHGRDDVALAFHHVAYQVGDLAGGEAMRVAVTPVGDDDGDAAGRDAARDELLDLGEHGGEDDGGLVVERSAAGGRVVVRVHALDPADLVEGVEDRAVQVAAVGQDALGLLRASH